jgi:hypothetical protein
VAIVCETLRDEYLDASAKCDCHYETRWIESGLHSFPNKLRCVLQQELDKYSADNTKARYDLLQRITERLKAIDDRLEEVEKAASATGGNKADNSRKLAEILSRPEYAHKVKNESALGRLLARFLEWLRSWMPKPNPI